MLGSLDHAILQLIVHTSASKRSSDFVARLKQFDDFYTLMSGKPANSVILVEDSGQIHVSKLLYHPWMRLTLGGFASVLNSDSMSRDCDSRVGVGAWARQSGLHAAI
jgi:hypothetical protein